MRSIPPRIRFMWLWTILPTAPSTFYGRQLHSTGWAFIPITTIATIPGTGTPGITATIGIITTTGTTTIPGIIITLGTMTPGIMIRGTTIPGTTIIMATIGTQVPWALDLRSMVCLLTAGTTTALAALLRE